MPFSLEIYQQSCEHYQTNWQNADEVLYRVARPHPGECTDAETNAKLLVIGRSYATGIERQVEDPKPTAMCRLSKFFHHNRVAINVLLEETSGLVEPLSTEKLQAIVDIHGRFVALLKNVTRPDKTPRTFASKYLHFHCPAVPIYDSYAADTAMPKLYPWRPAYEVFQIPDGADPYYAKFVFRFWRLYQDAIATGEQVTVKLLDYYLWYAEGLNGGQAE